jgi:hypothetical protein
VQIFSASSTIFCSVLFINIAIASDDGQQPMGIDVGHQGIHRADSHAPVGVMGDHMHGKGEWMLSYHFMRMEIKNSRDGSSSISPEEIATTVANPFFGHLCSPLL